PKKPSLPLQPLSVPDHPWQQVSYDMIVGLPNDQGNDAILVIVDSFSKYGILIACSSTINAGQVADLFLKFIWANHGLPESTVSDRGTVFHNKFVMTQCYDVIVIA